MKTKQTKTLSQKTKKLQQYEQGKKDYMEAYHAYDTLFQWLHSSEEGQRFSKPTELAKAEHSSM